MGEIKTRVRPYSSKGLAIKSDPGLIPEDQYLELTNLVSNTEGALVPRAGHQRLSSDTTLTSPIATITRLKTSGILGLAAKYYFFSVDGSMYYARSPLPIAGANLTFTPTGSTNLIAPAGLPYTRQRFSSVDYSGYATGITTKFFACPSTMRKATDGFLYPWGILPPPTPAIAVTTGSGTGPAAFTGAQVPYTYVYTFYNSRTGLESNPSPLWLTTGVTPNAHSIQVTVGWTFDTQVDKVRIYRAGGSFADSIYRLTGTARNASPGFNFLDTLQDAAIASNDIAVFDNDPPIISNLPVSMAATISAFVSGGGTPGTNVITLSVQPAGFSTQLSAITVGSRVSIGNPLSTTFEVCTIAAITPATSRITVYLQYTHVATEPVTCSAIAAAPATIACVYGNSIFIAGDPNNPNSLYQSKPGQPEAFPLLNLTTQVSQSIYISDPGDPINGLIEYNSQLLILNLASIFSVIVFNGVMGQPVRTPAKRGCINPSAYCRVANEIWYVAYDGIFSFTGGAETWKSAAIDLLFNYHPPTASLYPYAQIDMRPGLGTTGSDVITLICEGNEVFFSYQDTNGLPWRLRYHTEFDRWSNDIFSDTLGPNSSSITTAQYVEPDTGNLFLAKSVPVQVGSTITTTSYLYLDQVGSTDGWVNLPNDGAPIQIAVTPGPVCQPVAIDKLFSDGSIEYLSNDAAQIESHYDFSPVADGTDTFVLPVAISRSRFPFSFHNSHGMQAIAAAMRCTAATTSPFALYSITMSYWELAQFREGLAFDWDDLGYQDEKTLRWMELEIDTGGVTASLQIQGDGVDLLPTPLAVTTTSLDRRRTLALPSNLTARLIRPVIVPGQTGKTNYFGHKFEFVREPALLTVWDSYEWTPFDGYSFIKQAWLQYSSKVSITVLFLVDNNTQFYTVTLPAQPPPARPTQRFYLPAAVGRVLNKSKSHRIVIATDGIGMRLYKDGSGLEWFACGADQRQGYQQSSLNQLMAPQVA